MRLKPAAWAARAADKAAGAGHQSNAGTRVHRIIVAREPAWQLRSNKGRLAPPS
jgi:hypothetical protein